MLEVGKNAPTFSRNNSEGETVTLEDFAGKWLVLYFYPKDNTPGCTTEAQDFSQLRDRFAAKNAVILGVSPDSEQSHRRFQEKHHLSILLLSDPDHQMAEAYGVWQLKKFMGKEYMGIVRSTFLISPTGTLQKIWSPVKVKGHAQAVLEALESAEN